MRSRLKSAFVIAGLILGVFGCSSGRTDQASRTAAQSSLVQSVASPEPEPTTPLSPPRQEPEPAVSPSSQEVIGPGSLVLESGEQIPTSRETLVPLSLVTRNGYLAVGFRTNLAARYLDSLSKYKDNPYMGGKAFCRPDWIELRPKSALELSFADQSTRVKPVAGLVYGNQKGTLLLSVTDAPPPDGFRVFGQAQVQKQLLFLSKEPEVELEIQQAFFGRAE